MFIIDKRYAQKRGFINLNPLFCDMYQVHSDTFISMLAYQNLNAIY